MTQLKKTLRVLSCVPEQKYRFADKLAWVDQMAAQHKPELFVCPQEFHGGIQAVFFKDKTDEKMVYEEQEIVTPYLALARKHSMGITVGAVIRDPKSNENRERIWVIDPTLGVTGYADKMMLPAYDHVDAGGRAEVFPEQNMENRAQAFECMGARVSILFCWEVFSSYIWHAISRAQPDMVVSMIKFGVNGWPRKAKENGVSVVTGFGFGADGGWTERLQMAARWDVACPIICSTNSWDLPNKAGALAGMLLPWEEKETKGEYARPARSSTVWNSLTLGKGKIPEHVQVDQVDFLYWRLIREHKFTLNEATGEWPSSEARHLTMSWKVRRMERAFVGIPKLMAPIDAKKAVKAIATKQHDLFS